MKQSILLAFAGGASQAAIPTDCPAYDTYAAQRHAPYSTGRFQFPSQRPEPRCRTYAVPEVEETIERAKRQIEDPDLYRLFLNSWPNTVDTTILWRGVSDDNPDEEASWQRERGETRLD
ncbi:hypothetical protein RJ55_05503 [Drechmeria coniospora]|nr:hypothetical protein RJ55_05503 [Drechmeria coniospora]